MSGTHLNVGSRDTTPVQSSKSKLVVCTICVSPLDCIIEKALVIKEEILKVLGGGGPYIYMYMYTPNYQEQLDGDIHTHTHRVFNFPSTQLRITRAFPPKREMLTR